MWGKDFHDFYYAPNVSTITHGGRNAWGRRDTQMKPRPLHLKRDDSSKILHLRDGNIILKSLTFI